MSKLNIVLIHAKCCLMLKHILYVTPKQVNMVYNLVLKLCIKCKTEMGIFFFFLFFFKTCLGNLDEMQSSSQMSQYMKKATKPQNCIFLI